LKSKQTSIATVRYHLRTLASFPTPLIFHWSLPLKADLSNVERRFITLYTNSEEEVCSDLKGWGTEEFWQENTVHWAMGMGIGGKLL
jgi:hypothetical protein